MRIFTKKIGIACICFCTTALSNHITSAYALHNHAEDTGLIDKSPLKVLCVIIGAAVIAVCAIASIAKNTNFHNRSALLNEPITDLETGLPTGNVAPVKKEKTR